jgi:dihydroflavonol-4-reductase
VLAAERGELGRSYILGGENMTLEQMLATLADLCGLPAPRVRVSPQLVLPIVRTAEWFESTVLGREPTLPSEPVRMATTRMEYDTSRARTELGYTSIPARDALRRAATWYVEHGYVKPARVERIRNAGGLAPEVDLRIVPTEPHSAPSPATAPAES